MAKNKKQDRSQQRGSAAERGQQQAKSSSIESQSEQRATQVTPGDMARKSKQKRFGHN
ncbi:hypothetical protein [Streptomyces hiroshimensis]|uniref:Small hydrophilic protein n=1 Tax=Streptomyces hiroshimensis TaxID=66424 RepID=A0ABQ2YXD3_9ACTN|nr:hypothetical protein [Streptomyces hiroshimensis]GGX95609.1 hypothetical protein GCM10010324_47090 [Streptomyces hiroshimensis]